MLHIVLLFLLSCSEINSQDLFQKNEIIFRSGTVKELFVPLKEPYRKFLKKTRVLLRSNGCSCQELICGCCMDFNIQQFNFDRTGCMNITFNPQQFSMTMNMLWGQESIFQNTVSGKNPPPVCVPIIIPYIPISLATCFKIYDITLNLEDERMHACLDLEGKIENTPVLVLHFDCLQLGSNSTFAVVKPTMMEFDIDYDS